jgi:hypothetical protein
MVEGADGRQRSAAPYGRTAYPDIPVGAYGPPWSAWDRLGPDKFFSPLENGAKNRSSVFWFLREKRHRLWCAGRIKQVIRSV